MNIIPYPRRIFIVAGDVALLQSLKCLLETHDRVVRIFNRYEDFWAQSLHRSRDIVLLNFERSDMTGIRILNRLMGTARRPEIVITSERESIFEPDDKFVGNGVTVLFHPFTPDDLLKTIERL